MLDSAYMPEQMSATEKPTLLISPVPVTENTPASAWMARSYALSSVRGPPSP